MWRKMWLQKKEVQENGEFRETREIEDFKAFSPFFHFP